MRCCRRSRTLARDGATGNRSEIGRSVGLLQEALERAVAEFTVGDVRKKTDVLERRHAETETRLAAVEARLALLEGKAVRSTAAKSTTPQPRATSTALSLVRKP